MSFLSTLPVRGATAERQKAIAENHISIHAPREGSDVAVALPRASPSSISIHAPREGSDGGLYIEEDA